MKKMTIGLCKMWGPEIPPSIYAIILWHFIRLLSAFAHVLALLLGVISLQRLAAFCREPWRKFLVGWKISAQITYKHSNSTGGRHFCQPRVPQNAQFNAQMNSKVVSPRPTVHFHITLGNDITSTPVLDIVQNNKCELLEPQRALPSVRSLIKWKPKHGI